MGSNLGDAMELFINLGTCREFSLDEQAQALDICRGK